MPSPGNKSPSLALSSTVWFLKRPNFIEGNAAFPPMEKVEVRKCWRRERNWGRTFSTWANVEESNPAYGAPAGGAKAWPMAGDARKGRQRAFIGAKHPPPLVSGVCHL